MTSNPLDTQHPKRKTTYGLISAIVFVDLIGNTLLDNLLRGNSSAIGRNPVLFAFQCSMIAFSVALVAWAVNKTVRPPILLSGFLVILLLVAARNALGVYRTSSLSRYAFIMDLVVIQWVEIAITFIYIVLSVVLRKIVDSREKGIG